MRAFVIAVLAISTLVLSGCEKENEARVRKLTEAQTDESIRREQDALNERVTKMELSLKDRYQLYENFGGTFEGETVAKNPQYNVKVVAAVNQPLYQGDRVRTQAEVEEDLRTLGLNIQVLVYDPLYPTSAVGCRFEGIKPNPNTHEAIVIRESCPNAFKFIFNETEVQGIMQPSTTAEEMPFTARRTQ